MRRFRLISLSFMLPALLPALIRAQAQAGPMIRPEESASVYENSAAGLHLQLQEALAAAKNHDRSRLESLIRQMEIPNSEAWFTKSYGQAKGESWAEPYRRELANRERDLEAALLEFGTEAGQLLTRQVNTAPQPGMEAGMIAELQQPADIFYAGWRRQESLPNSKDEPIGYFVFLEGRFRWDSTIVLLKIQQDQTQRSLPPQATVPDTQVAASSQLEDDRYRGIARPGSGGIGYPTCLHCPSPKYSKAARKERLKGTVVLQAVVQADGSATDIQVVKSPNPELTEMALEGVSQWRFNPARRANGQAVSVVVPIEITFRLLL